MSMSIRQAGLSLACSALVAWALGTSASAETLLRYRGRLSNAEARPVPDGPYDFLFAVYGSPSGGQPLWQESHAALIVQEGQYAAALGSETPLGLPEGRYWLETVAVSPAIAAAPIRKSDASHVEEA